MEELLILIIQGCFEVVFEVLGSGLLDVSTWWWDTPDTRPSLGCFGLLLVFGAGCLVGWLSLLVVSHHLMPFRALRIANLVVGPLLSGWVAWRLARRRQTRHPGVVPRHHALIAATASLGIVLVRFVWGIRS